MLFAKASSAILCVFLLAGPAETQDWPQWRGPNRDGVISPSEGPKTWPPELKQKWQTTVGLGHSSPLLVNRKVYLLTRLGDDEVVSCFDLVTGGQIWRDRYPAPYVMNPAAARHGKGPKSTPVYQGGTLCTLGISGILSCYDAEKGNLRWRNDFGKQFANTLPLYGTAASPLIDRGMLIAHVGGHDNGALAAFDLESGKMVWSWKGDGPSYASPIILDADGVHQVITQSQQNLIGISATDGKLLWSIPFTTAYVQNAVTPVAYGQTLIFSGLDKGISAFKLVQSGTRWAPAKIWENSADSFYMSTPVINGDLLLGMSHKNKGRFVALDIRTGKTLWSTAGREGDNSAVLAAGDKVFFLTDNAELIVAKASRSGFEQLRRYTVAKSPTWAHPVLAGKYILVKDAESLTLWSAE